MDGQKDARDRSLKGLGRITDPMYRKCVREAVEGELICQGVLIGGEEYSEKLLHMATALNDLARVAREEDPGDRWAVLLYEETAAEVREEACLADTGVILSQGQRAWEPFWGSGS